MPTNILLQVQANEAATADHRKNVVAIKDSRDLDKARLVLLKLYPRAPLDSAELILKHGYFKGSGRVGRTSTLSDEEKMKLAASAHVRHKLTDYDLLLRERKMKAGKEGRKKNFREEVRREISGEVRRIIKSWGPLGDNTAQLAPTKSVTPAFSAKGLSIRPEKVKQLQRKSHNGGRQNQREPAPRGFKKSNLRNDSTSEVAITSSDELETASEQNKQGPSPLHGLPARLISDTCKSQRGHLHRASKRYAYVQEDWIDDDSASAVSENSGSDSGASEDFQWKDKALNSPRVYGKELKAIQEISNRLNSQHTPSPGRVTRESLKKLTAGSSPIVVSESVIMSQGRRVSKENCAAVEAYKPPELHTKLRLKSKAHRRAEAARAALAEERVALRNNPQDAERIRKAIRRCRRWVGRAELKAKKASRNLERRGRLIEAGAKLVSEDDDFDIL